MLQRCLLPLKPTRDFSPNKQPFQPCLQWWPNAFPAIKEFYASRGATLGDLTQSLYSCSPWLGPGEAHEMPNFDLDRERRGDLSSPGDPVSHPVSAPGPQGTCQLAASLIQQEGQSRLPGPHSAQ